MLFWECEFKSTEDQVRIFFTIFEEDVLHHTPRILFSKDKLFFFVLGKLEFLSSWLLYHSLIQYDVAFPFLEELKNVIYVLAFINHF
jgi:hypothetical protein